MQHLWLTGMMGTGKSTVGPIAAQILGLPFLDVDSRIVVAEGRSIAEIFRDGEQAFRDLERREILAAASQPPSVIATGGGAVLDESNVAAMRSTGTIVLLVADTEALAERVAHDRDRPLSGSIDDLSRLASVRRRAYLHAADHVVDTTETTPEAAAREVVECAAM